MEQPVSTLERRGWELVRLRSETLEVDVVPEKGGDITAIRWRPLGLDLLFETPWGLRARGAVATGGDSLTAFMESYPGGWQTIFPNGGTAVVVDDVEIGFHGEAAMVPWTWERAGDGADIELAAVLVRSPFTMRRRLRLDGSRLTVAETVRNEGRRPAEVMWSHHPAFGAPFLDGSCRLESGARRVVVDDERDTPYGDLAGGGEGAWPHAPAKDGGSVDLTVVPGPDVACERLGYLLDFEEGWFTLTNPTLGVAVTMRWDAMALPCAWLWFEGHATPGWPWYQRAYALAVEPGTSYPAQGLDAARTKTGSTVLIEPGEERSVELTFEVAASPS